jgi:lipoprotein-releasing system ATP-binding protein
VSEATALLELENVTKRYPAAESEADVLRGVSLRVAPGDAVAVVGPSGSGKSTLLNIIGALDTPTSGRVRLDGEDLAGLSADALADVRSRSIGFVFQSHHLLPQLSALENALVPTLVAARRASGPPGAAELRNRAQRLLETVGLGHRLTHRPGRLSGGECQRVAVVRALINEPRLLLADEPTGSLDEGASDDLGALLLQLNADHGVSLVVVTHSMRLAERMGRVLQLRDGRLAPAEAPA